ncbi:MAG TPA: uroporphyrinogen decarboxylase family protein [Candidatus Hydrogenedentes bacterium]|nr:uroporphyrinogen decarboxylase family protein [Candidatus Hydrogenedentota bacterium]HOL77712.1 uroporphyrinogen decarboxylase family protein [Candidatus Hydrogenedentota bacterium]HPO86835.1 uroporphyrinogen decarboxylase family protein [Candidatus Hydrogenedentota bacterium]
MMTKRERVLRTARFEETDRVPLYDIFQNDAVIQHYSGQFPTPELGVRPVAFAVGRALDMTRMVSAPQPSREIVHENGFRIRTERWTSWIVERPFHDTETLLPWVKQEIRRLSSCNYSDDDKRRFFEHIDTLRAIFAEADPTGRKDPTVLVIESGVGLTEMYHSVGMELFSELMYEAPDLVEEWLETRLQLELRRVERIADPDVIPIALTYDDIAHKTGTLFSPDWLRKYWVPRLKRLTDAWHSRGVLCLFHSDGNLWGVMNDLVGAGIDGLNPLETLAEMTVEKVRSRYPNLFLAGGIDVSQLLTVGTPDEVRAACQQAIRVTEGRGFFMGSSTELHWEVPLENAIAMFETAWESAKN